MKDLQRITKEYEVECPQGHKHEMKVSYNFQDEEITISKEMPATMEEIEEERREIKKLVERKECFFCEKKVDFNLLEQEPILNTDNYLAGFRHKAHDPTEEHKEPICQSCWKEKYESYMQYDTEYYTSLEEGGKIIGIKGDEELRNCSALTGDYPKKR